MPSIRFVASLSTVLATSICNPVFAATVNVSLSDHGAANMPSGMGFGMSEADMSNGPMQITAVPATVKAGEVTLHAVNMSKDLEHELIIAPLGNAGKSLPYKTESQSVDEEAAKALGEVEERQPGESGDLTAELQPGKYILFCNVPGHFMAGMWAVLSVEPN
jgi:uncharacterized cupredoxin-like copper-binding protein